MTSKTTHEIPNKTTDLEDRAMVKNTCKQPTPFLLYYTLEKKKKKKDKTPQVFNYAGVCKEDYRTA